MSAAGTADTIDTPCLISRRSLRPMSRASTAPVVSRAVPRTAGQPPAPRLARVDEFELIALAGRGTFADVWQVRNPRTGRLHAVKQLRADYKDQPAARRILENEAEG